MINLAGEGQIRRTILSRILHLSRWTSSAVFAGCVCIGLLSQEAVATDLVPPDTSSWIDYEAPEHGYAFKGPADWQSSYPAPETSRNIVVLRHPDNGSACALLYTALEPGVEIDIDGYVEYMTDERLIEMASLKYSSVTLILKKAVQDSNRKGLLSIFAGKREPGHWFVMTLSTVRENKIYELQCLSRPEVYNEIFPIFLVMGDSLEIAPE